MEVNHNEPWPYNLLCRVFNQEDLIALKANAPKELEAFLIYSVRDVYSDWDADVILKYFMDQMPPDAIAKSLRLKKDRVEEVLLHAGENLKDPLLTETYRKGLVWRVEQEKQNPEFRTYARMFLIFILRKKNGLKSMLFPARLMISKSGIRSLHWVVRSGSWIRSGT